VVLVVLGFIIIPFFLKGSPRRIPP